MIISEELEDPWVLQFCIWIPLLIYLKSSTTAFNFKLVTDLQVTKCIQHLKSKSSTGHDNISNNLFKYLEPLLSEPILLIINQSLASGIFPEKLNLANII